MGISQIKLVPEWILIKSANQKTKIDENYQSNLFNSKGARGFETLTLNAVKLSKTIENW